jgi:biopolymer transport protein ExbD
MRLGRGRSEKAEIPTCSMADIAFLLIIFFMVTTVFRTEQGLSLDLPRAAAAEKLPRRNIAHIWVKNEEMMTIDDNFVSIASVSPIMSQKLQINPGIIVSILTDENASYGVMADIFDELKDAGALKVSLASKIKRGG